MNIHRIIPVIALVGLTGCTVVPDDYTTHRSVVVYSDNEPNRVIVRKSDPGYYYRYHYDTPRYYQQDSYRYYYRYYY